MDWGKFDQLLKKREAAMFYDMTEREIKAYQRRKAQHELECVERRKQFEAKWKAEDELFFLKHGITRDEVLYGKKPDIPPVVIPVADTVVVASAVELVVEAEIKPDVVGAIIDDMAVDAEVIPTVEALVDVLDEHVERIVAFEEFTCPIVEEEVPKDEAVVDIHVVYDVDRHDMSVHTVTEPIVEAVEQTDCLSLSTCSSHISFPLQVHLQHLLEGDTGLLITPNTAPILHTDVFALVDMQGKPEDIHAAYISYDPFMVHCTPFAFIVAAWFVVPIRLALREMAIWFTYLFFMVVRHSAGLLTYVQPRLLFDPGGFEDESFRTGRE